MRWLVAMAVAMLAASGARAAEDPAPRIVVSGTATVSTPPDLATIEFRIVGEGATSDAAVAAMVAKQQAIAAAIGTSESPRAGNVAITAVRGVDCHRDDEGDEPRLSTGKCAVIGYVATLSATLRTERPIDAGTMVGLLGRAGAQNPRLEDFALASPANAQRRAIAAAIADARAKAEAIAAATGVRLGRLLIASTESHEDMAQDIVVTGSRLAPPALSLPPIVVTLAPRPIETRAQVTVTYAIAP